MTKTEFEKIAGYEVENRMYEDVIEPIYMATDIDKFTFAKMLDKTLFERKTEKEFVTVKVNNFDNGTILHFNAELIDIDIANGKPIVKRLSENRAWGLTNATYNEFDCIVIQ